MQNDSKATLDQDVRRYVYDQTIKTAVLPTIAETAAALSGTLTGARASFQRLADAHVLVLQKDTGEVLKEERSLLQHEPQTPALRPRCARRNAQAFNDHLATVRGVIVPGKPKCRAAALNELSSTSWNCRPPRC